MSIDDVPTKKQIQHIDKWIRYGTLTISHEMRFNLTLAIVKTITGSGSQFDDMRRLIAAEGFNCWAEESWQPKYSVTRQKNCALSTAPSKIREICVVPPPLKL